MVSVFEKIVEREKGEKEAEKECGEPLQDLGRLIEKERADLLEILQEEVERLRLREADGLIQSGPDRFDDRDRSEPSPG